MICSFMIKSASMSEDLYNKKANALELQSEVSQGTADKVCGVEKPLVEAFLNLIKDNYIKADQAGFFLEERTGISNIQGIAHLRDVLSHLVTFLTPGIPEDKRQEQISNAEEHFRRAIVEPYEIAFSQLLGRFSEIYQKYKESLLPVKQDHISLYDAPDEAFIDARLSEIRDLASKGRTAKSLNLWDQTWELSVASFIDAYNTLSTLYSELESYWYKYERIDQDLIQANQIEALKKKLAVREEELFLQVQKTRRLMWWGIATTLVTTLLALLITILLARR